MRRVSSFSVVTLFLVGAATSAGAAVPVGNAPVPQVLAELFSIMSAHQRGNTGELRLKYTELSRQRPGDPLPRVYVAYCDLPSDEAWNLLKGVATIHPDNPWVRLGMAQVYASWKMRDQAKAELDAALKTPGFYPAVTQQADLALAQGDAKQAEALYRKSLSMGEDARAHAGLGQLLLQQGNKPDGLTELRRAVELWPDQLSALKALVQNDIESLGMTQVAPGPGAYKAVADRAAKIADLAPKDRDARRTVAELRFKDGDKPAAALEYERLLRLGDVDQVVLERLAQLHRDLGDGEAEERALQQLAALDKQNPQPNVRLAELMLARGAKEAAEGQLLEAVDRAPTLAQAHLLLARLRAQHERFYEAVESYRAGAQGAGEGVEAAKKEGAELEQKLKLPAKKPKGSVDAIYGAVASSLNSFFAERRREKPALAGELKMRVRVAADGVVKGVDVVSDTVQDPLLVAHVYFALKDATYPKQKREPVFEFELKGPKGAKAP